MREGVFAAVSYMVAAMSIGQAAHVIGIDLGTTNCAVASAPLTGDDEARAIADFVIPQVIQPGQVDARPILPAFLYLPSSHEFPKGSLALPWGGAADCVVGELARDHGARVPQRLISSAKSWLCHEGANRRGPILPLRAPDEVARLSPVEVATRYLQHLRDAWNHEHAEAPMEHQEIVLTVPASFDVVARELTAEAARASGFENLTLLEEPQAALYSWLASAGEAWRDLVRMGDMILVCDVGGGTTDYSLIEVSEEEGSLVLDRIAVGAHILLGGDNMDLALAFTLQNRLKASGTRLEPWQFQALVHGCRAAKERLLVGEEVEACPIVIPGRGTSLIGGSTRTELRRDDVHTALLEGFFPVCDPGDHAVRQRRSGLTELGLPFESDPAVTRHLASFLGVHVRDRKGRAVSGETFIHPSVILFNGGVMKASRLRGRVRDIVDLWLEAESAPPARELVNVDLDRAVARGAAHYGRVRHGKGIRIRGGTSKTYYIGVEVSRPAVPGMLQPIKAVCVAAHGMEEGTQADLPGQEFGLVVGEPAEFRFLSSATRRGDEVGCCIDPWEPGDEGIEETTTVSATLDADNREGSVIPVRLRTAVTEVGTLEVWCVEREGTGKWKLEFDVREREAPVDPV